ncbi:MAG: RNA polymerase sigma factor [Elusimicrobia bacterium]|nr:RNA polymerase sigma factor [Elusimicrobiota bacterium]
MEISTEEEKELIAAAAEGDRRAFELLMRSAQQQVYTLALRLTKSEAEADDITQETFISAWKHLPSFRLEIPFRAWAMKIALNKCRSFWRWSSLRRLVSLETPDDGTDEHAPQGREFEDHSLPRPEQACESLERAAMINKALDTLSAKQREAAILRGQGLELSEIADIMRTAQGTIKAHLFEARRKLASALKEGL